MKKALVIHTDKVTGEYERFEVYPLNENLTMEKVQEALENWNKSESQKTKAILCNDELVVEAFEDCQTSKRNDFIIENLRGVVRDIESAVMDLESWVDDIEERLRRCRNEKE